MNHNDENWLTAGIGMALSMLVIIPMIILIASYIKEVALTVLVMIALVSISSVVYKTFRNK